ncbi:hypothetical protein EV401DRAFT_159340 [Pisolithus croceorrhizus]|nr:hypothetical protein EV401DRAFT_159340 [Pisolithus croceorrhizus]
MEPYQLPVSGPTSHLGFSSTKAIQLVSHSFTFDLYSHRDTPHSQTGERRAVGKTDWMEQGWGGKLFLALMDLSASCTNIPDRLLYFCDALSCSNILVLLHTVCPSHLVSSCLTNNLDSAHLRPRPDLGRVHLWNSTRVITSSQFTRTVAFAIKLRGRIRYREMNFQTRSVFDRSEDAVHVRIRKYEDARASRKKHFFTRYSVHSIV